jgi:hypothetical protein
MAARGHSWSPDGKELFYRRGTALMRVAVGSETGFTRGTPARLFDGPYTPNYDIDPSGRRFLIIKDAPPRPASDSDRIIVVLNWFEELKRLVPVK